MHFIFEHRYKCGDWLPSEEHEAALSTIAERLSSPDVKIVRIRSPLPDLIEINWKTRQVTAVELNTSGFSNSKRKHYREAEHEYDALRIFVSAGKVVQQTHFLHKSVFEYEKHTGFLAPTRPYTKPPRDPKRYG